MCYKPLLVMAASPIAVPIVEPSRDLKEWMEIQGWWRDGRYVPPHERE